MKCWLVGFFVCAKIMIQYLRMANFINQQHNKYYYFHRVGYLKCKLNEYNVHIGNYCMTCFPPLKSPNCWTFIIQSYYIL